MANSAPVPGSWQTDLDNFFATLDKEDKTFTDNLQRQAAFFRDTARPALEAAAAALRPHSREAEVGAEPERVYLIVRKLTGEVEFQYAVVAEVRIEAVTPYIHCWFEENKLAEQLAKEQGTPEKPAGDDQKNPDDQKSDDAGGDEGGEDDKKDDEEPTRTKTIEVLSTWREGRGIESVTQEEILTDFLQHYKEAVGLARTQLHVAPPGSSAQ